MADIVAPLTTPPLSPPADASDEGQIQPLERAKTLVATTLEADVIPSLSPAPAPSLSTSTLFPSPSLLHRLQPRLSDELTRQMSITSTSSSTSTASVDASRLPPQTSSARYPPPLPACPALLHSKLPGSVPLLHPHPHPPPHLLRRHHRRQRARPQSGRLLPLLLPLSPPSRLRRALRSVRPLRWPRHHGRKRIPHLRRLHAGPSRSPPRPPAAAAPPSHNGNRPRPIPSRCIQLSIDHLRCRTKLLLAVARTEQAAIASVLRKQKPELTVVASPTCVSIAVRPSIPPAPPSLPPLPLIRSPPMPFPSSMHPSTPWPSAPSCEREARARQTPSTPTPTTPMRG